MDVITFPEHLYTTSGLSILLYGVISLHDTTSYDKHYNRVSAQIFDTYHRDRHASEAQASLRLWATQQWTVSPEPSLHA